MGVADDQGDHVPVYQSGDTNGNGLLDVGETWIYAATGMAVAGQLHQHRHRYGNGNRCHGHRRIRWSRPRTPTAISACSRGLPVGQAHQRQTTNPNVAAGSQVTWTYDVTNTGNVALERRDGDRQTRASLRVYQSGDANGNGLLDVGETWIYTATGTAIAGQYTEHRHGHGTDAHGHSRYSRHGQRHATATSASSRGSPMVKLTNGTHNPNVAAGSTVTWTYDVTNTGNVRLERRDGDGQRSDCHPVLYRRRRQWQRPVGRGRNLGLCRARHGRRRTVREHRHGHRRRRHRHGRHAGLGHGKRFVLRRAAGDSSGQADQRQGQRQCERGRRQRGHLDL